MHIKKDKNLSTAIYYVLNSNKSPGHKKNLEDLKINLKSSTTQSKALKRNLEMI